MAVKYHCPKCDKRFVDWGAEKLGFKCPDCEDEKLVRIGMSEAKPARKPTLKRKAKVAKVVPEVEFALAEEVNANELPIALPVGDDLADDDDDVVKLEADLDADVLADDDDAAADDLGAEPQELDFSEADAGDDVLPDVDEKL